MTLIGSERPTKNPAEIGYRASVRHWTTFMQRQNLYRRQLPWINFLGMMDPAYYSQLPHELGNKGYVDWHLHALVWGISEKALDLRCKKIRRMLWPLVPGTTPAFYRPVGPGDLLQVLWYINKAPRKQYSVQQRYPTKRYIQHKSTANGVSSVRLYSQMSDLYLDQLGVAGGEGIGLLKAIKREALRPFRKGRRAGKSFI